MGARDELTSYEYRQLRARVLAASDICIMCGHSGSQATDHVIPVARGGARLDPDNLAPIHGIERCPVCGRLCNNDKGDKLLSEVKHLNTSVDWYAGPST